MEPIQVPYTTTVLNPGVEVMINCCNGCKDRHQACHVKCPSYIKENKEHIALREKIHQEKDLEAYFSQRAYHRQKSRKN